MLYTIILRYVFKSYDELCSNQTASELLTEWISIPFEQLSVEDQYTPSDKCNLKQLEHTTHTYCLEEACIQTIR